MPRFNIKQEIFPLCLLAIAVVASFYFYAHFPERVPLHWNLAGQVNGWGGRASAFYLPAVIIGMYLLFLILPWLDPKQKNYEQFAKVYYLLKVLLIAFMVIIYFILGLSGLGVSLPVGLIMPMLVGLLFMAIGANLHKVKSNWFVGIRTPWTLSSDDIWDKTHRFGGRVFVLAGLLIFSTGLTPAAWILPIFITAIALIVIGTIGYSYLEFLKSKK